MSLFPSDTEKFLVSMNAMLGVRTELTCIHVRFYNATKFLTAQACLQVRNKLEHKFVFLQYVE